MWRVVYVQRESVSSGRQLRVGVNDGILNEEESGVRVNETICHCHASKELNINGIRT